MARATKKKTVHTPRQAKFTEEKHVGHEITDWTGVELRSGMKECFRHYNYFYDNKDAVAWVIQWMKSNRSKEDIQKYQKAQNWRTSITLGGLCRMHTNGAPFDSDQIGHINKEIDDIISASAKEPDAEKPIQSITKSPAEALKEKTSDFIAELEHHVDTWKEDTEFSAYLEMKKFAIAYNTAKAVQEYYEPLVAELEELITKKTPDLVEAYKLWSVADRKKYLEFIRGIVKDASLYMNTKKAVRKPRAKKAVSVTQATAKVQYQKEDPITKIVSVDPINIVGANTVYLYNTRYRTLSKLVSMETGFTVKGTTIGNIDMEKSEKRKLRKPELFFAETSKTTKAKLDKTFESLKVKPAIVNGRVNNETIIYKAFK